MIGDFQPWFANHTYYIFGTDVTTCGLQEAKNKVIKLEGSNPTIVKLMLQFMYTSDYDDTPEDLEPNEPRDPITEKTENDFHRVDNNTQVYALADKYEVNGLKALALKKFSALEGIDWGCDEFANLARDIYETTPASDRGLRDVMKDNFTGRYRELSSNPVWLRVIKETPDLCFDLLKGSLDMFFADKDKKASYFEKVLRTLDAACPHCKDFFCYMFKYGFLDDEQQKCTMTCSLCGAKQEVSRD